LKIFKRKRGSNLLEALKGHRWSDVEERDQLLAELLQTPDLGIDDLGWLPTDRDSALRKVGGKLIRALESQHVVPYYVKRWNDLVPVKRRLLAKELGDLAPAGWEQQIERYLQAWGEKQRLAAEDILHLAPITRHLRRLLVKRADTGEADVRRRALTRLLEAPEKRTLPLFEKFIGDPDERIRAKVIRALSQDTDERYLDLLASRIEVESYALQQQLVEVMLKYSEAGFDVTSQVLPLLSGGDPALRATALRILTQMPDQKRVVREFITYSKDFAGWVRRRALDSMAAFGDALKEPIIALLQDKDATIRSTAILLAANVSPDAHLEKALIPLLQDPDWWVRINAAECLGRLGGATSVPHLVSLLEDPDTRWSALEALARLKDRRCLKPVLALLDQPEVEVRTQVIQTLARMAFDEALPRLKEICKTDERLEVRHEAYGAIKTIKGEINLSDAENEELKRGINYLGGLDLASQPPLVQLLLRAREQEASDVHLSVGRPPMVRLQGVLQPLDDTEMITDKSAIDLLRPLLTPDEEQQLLRNLSFELCYEIPDQGRYRGSIFVDRKGLNAVFRLIPNTVPTLTDIGMPTHIAEVASWHQGLVLVVGPASSGKTTTMAAMIDLFNETRQSHIITIEDPIEYVHRFKSCLINQRQIGSDTTGYYRALRGALREDPDIIVLGEMRDSDTIRLALEAAETGHLVLATINGTSAIRAVGRLVNAFPPEQQPQTRMMLADTIKLVIGQSLMPRANADGRVAVFEILMGSQTVASVVRENKDYMLASLMQTGYAMGMRTFDDALMGLVEDGTISSEHAYLRSKKKERFEPLVSEEFLEEGLA
jgi:twitching motility protein PilT